MQRSQLTTVKKILWVAYLAIALVFIQGARLHVHTYSHDPATPDHAHLEQAHFDHGSQEHGHPDELGQVDLSQQGFLKKLIIGSLAIAVFFTVIMLLPLSPSSRRLRYFIHRTPIHSQCFGLRPPLRAPPL